MTYSELLLAVQAASLTIFGTLPSKKKVHWLFLALMSLTIGLLSV